MQNVNEEKLEKVCQCDCQCDCKCEVINGECHCSVKNGATENCKCENCSC